jgi:hypothetical protein
MPSSHSGRDRCALPRTAPPNLSQLYSHAGRDNCTAPAGGAAQVARNAVLHTCAGRLYGRGGQGTGRCWRDCGNGTLPQPSSNNAAGAGDSGWAGHRGGMCRDPISCPVLGMMTAGERGIEACAATPSAARAKCGSRGMEHGGTCHISISCPSQVRLQVGGARRHVLRFH